MTADDELPGIHRLAVCSTSSTVGFTLKYNPNPAGGDDNEVSKYQRTSTPGGFLVMQIAMSYSTLAEVSDDEDDVESVEDKKLKAKKIQLRKNRQALRKKNAQEMRDNDGDDLESDEDEDEDDDCSEDDEGDEGDSNRDHNSKEDVTSPDTLLSGKRENSELEYADRISENLDIQLEQKEVHDLKAKEANELMLKFGNRIAKSKFRRQASTRGPMRYLHTKKLCAVRRLRVMTVMVECTPKIPRLIKSANSSMMAVLIVRRSLALLQKNAVDESLEYLYNWSVEMTVSLCRIIWKHKQQQQKSAVVNNEPEDWNGGGKSYTGIEYPDIPPEDRVDAVVSEGMAYGKIWRFLQVMYGAVHMTLMQKHFLQHLTRGKDNDSGHGEQVRGRGGGDAASSNTLLFSKSWGDSFAEICSLLMTSDINLAEKILYPEMLAISTDKLCVDRQPLLLKREELITTGQSMYLIDSGRDVVLYRTMIKQNMSTPGLVPGQQLTTSRSASSLSAPSPPLPLPSSVVPPPPAGSTTSTDTGTGGMMSAAVSAATSLLYPPPPNPPPDTTNVIATESGGAHEEADEEQQEARMLLLKNPQLLVNDINRRVYTTPAAPRVLLAEAGKLSSSFFTG